MGVHDLLGRRLGVDGVPDIVFNSILGRVGWLRNEGPRDDPRLAASEAIEVEWDGPAPKPAWTWWNPAGKELVTQWRTTPVVYDFNRDGLPDLAMLDTEGYLAFYERARRDDRLVLLPPRRAFLAEDGTPLRLNDKRAGGSGRRKLCVTDWNGDGRFDFLVNSHNADLLEQIDSPPGNWRFRAAGPLAEQNVEGHDVSPTTVDFDGDGVSDFLGGAEDGRFYWLENPRSRTAGKREPRRPRGGTSVSNPVSSHDQAMETLAELGRGRKLKPLDPHPRWRRFRQAISGLVWFATLSLIISLLTKTAFLVVFPLLLGVALACGVLGMIWMAHSRLDAPHRFSIATLLFATFYIAVYLGSVRWLVVASMAAMGVPDVIALDFLIPGIIWLLICLGSVRTVFGLLDSLVWLAVWLVRRPSVRRWLAGRRRR